MKEVSLLYNHIISSVDRLTDDRLNYLLSELDSYIIAMHLKIKFNDSRSLTTLVSILHEETLGLSPVVSV